MVYKHFFGRSPEGQAITRFTLFNHNTMEVSLINYGARIHSVCFPDKNGNVEEILLGCDSCLQYANSPHFGATMGPDIFSNPEFMWDQVCWKWKTDDIDNVVVFQYETPDGEKGHLPLLKAEVRYCLTQEDALIVHYSITSQKEIPVSCTNFAYWNLSGSASDTVSDLRLEVCSDGSDCSPTYAVNGFDSVVRYSFDFNEIVPLTSLISQYPNGFNGLYSVRLDSNDDSILHPVAELSHPSSGRILSVYSTETALQVSSSPELSQITGRHGQSYLPFNGLRISPLSLPNQSILSAGETFESETVFVFSHC